MKCLKLISPGHLKFFKNEKTPEIDDESIIIKVKYCGICSSDIKFINTGHRIKRYPVTLGHEISGLVYKIGKNVKKVKPNDDVILIELETSLNTSFIISLSFIAGNFVIISELSQEIGA